MDDLIAGTIAELQDKGTAFVGFGRLDESDLAEFRRRCRTEARNAGMHLKTFREHTGKGVWLTDLNYKPTMEQMRDAINGISLPMKPNLRIVD